MAVDRWREKGAQGGSFEGVVEVAEGETSCIIMQKLSQQLDRSRSMPLHRQRHVARCLYAGVQAPPGG